LEGLIYFEDFPHRTRASFAGEKVVDSRHAKLLHEHSHSQPATAISAGSCSPALLLIAPGETPMTRLKARLNAASDR
jgi:hypothetical protein